MILEHEDYRTFLKKFISNKTKANSKYSIRSFAENFQISNSFLSEVLNGKKSLSVDLAFKMAVKMNLTETETQYLCLMVQLENEKDIGFKEELLRRLNVLNPKRASQDLSVDLFKVISDWYHLAILELAFLPHFKISADSVSDKIGISIDEAKTAIDRLVRLELLEKNHVGDLRKVDSHLLAESTVPNQAFKNYHRQVLEKAIQSLDTQDLKSRMSATDMVAIDSKFLPKVDQLSREFSSALLELSRKSKLKTDVYALSVHFFKITNERQSL